MRITSNEQPQSGGGGFGGGFQDFGGSSPDFTVDDMLAAAKAEGGALGDAAERLSNPKTSFFSTVREETVGALGKFIDILMTPSYAIGGLLDPTRTMAEGIQDKVTPGDYMLERPSEIDSFGTKAAYQVKKFAVDTMLDPLTYVTFGASRGIVGLSKGKELIASKNLAKELGKKEGTRVYLSKRGEDLATRYYQSQMNGARQQFLRNERVKMVNEGVPEEEIVKTLKELDDTASDFLIKTSLNQKIDMQEAQKAVSNLLESKPHLAATLIDKGGIKFFGRSILSGQRIRAVKQLLPGMTALDRATEPVRGYIGNMFSTQYVNGSRMSDELHDTNERWRLLQESKKGELIREGERLRKELNLSGNEWEFITAAVEKGIRPRDPKAADAYRLLHGEEPVNGTIRNEVWQGMIGVQKMLKRTRKELWNEGVPTRDMSGYMPHMLVTEDVMPTAFQTSGMRSTLDAQKFARLSTLVDENGKRIPVQFEAKPDGKGVVKGTIIKDGREETREFLAVNSQREINKIEATAKKEGRRLYQAMNDLKARVTGAKAEITIKIGKSATDAIEESISDLKGLSNEERKTIAEMVTNLVGANDINRLVSETVTGRYKDGVKIKGAQGTSQISAPDIEKIIKTAIKKEQSAEEVAAALKARLRPLPSKEGPRQAGKKGTKTAPTSKEAVDPDKDIFKLAEEIRKQTKASREDIVKKGLNEDAVRQFITRSVDAFADNPAGIQRALDRIFEGSQAINEIGEEIVDLSRAVKMDREELASQSGKFIDTVSGKAYERVRAQIEEAKQFNADFEENALAISLLQARDNIKVATTKGFLREVGEKFGVRESQAHADFVTIDKLDMKYEGTDISNWLVAKNGERLMFPKEVADSIQRFTSGVAQDEGVNQFLRAYDGLQNWFKAAVTSIFPAFHGRNALSNVFMMYNKIGAEVLDPVNHTVTANMLEMERKTKSLQRKLVKGTVDMAEYSRMMTKEMFTDAAGYRWSWGELRSQMLDNVVSFHPKNVGQVDQLSFGRSQVNDLARKVSDDSTGQKFNTAMENTIGKDNFLFRGGYKIGQSIEDYSRTLTFIANLRKTSDPMQSARVTKMALFDYSNLTKFEKEVMRRIIPFYTFSRKNIELQVNTLLTNPGRIAQEIRGVQALGDAFSGEELSPEEIDALPDWAKKGYNIVTSREGSNITLMRTLGTPLEEVFQRMDASANIGVVSPLIKFPLELGLGYSTFHGRPISEVTRADAYQFAPEYIKEFIGYAEVKYTDGEGNPAVYHTSFNPERMFMLNNLQPFGRAMSEINRLENTDNASARMGALIFGFGAQDFDIEKEAARRNKENKEALQKVLDQGNVGYTFELYVPPTTNTETFEGF